MKLSHARTLLGVGLFVLGLVVLGQESRITMLPLPPPPPMPPLPPMPPMPPLAPVPPIPPVIGADMWLLPLLLLLALTAILIWQPKQAGQSESGE